MFQKKITVIAARRASQVTFVLGMVFGAILTKDYLTRKALEEGKGGKPGHKKDWVTSATPDKGGSKVEVGSGVSSD